MNRRLLPTLCLLAFLGGCTQTRKAPMGAPQRPAPAPELAKLERMVGTWAGTTEIVKPSPEKLKKMMLKGAMAPPSSFQGGMKCEWVLGGLYLKNEGWHEMGGGQKANFVEYITWDKEDKDYHSYYFSDWNERGEGCMKFNRDGKTLRATADGIDMGGSDLSGKGTMTFVDDDTIEWKWSEKGSMGKMEMKGTFKRKK